MKALKALEKFRDEPSTRAMILLHLTFVGIIPIVRLNAL